MSWIVGCDTGGTFTDVVRGERLGRARASRRCRRRRRTSTSAVVEGVRALGIAPAEVETLFHGTTVTTNAVITKTGAPSALVTTLRLPGRARDPPRQPRGALRHPLGSAAAARSRAATGSRSTSASTTRARSCGRSTSESVRAVGAQDPGARTRVGGRLPDQRAHEPGARAAGARDPPRGAARACTSRCRRTSCPEPPEFERTATTVANAYCAPVLRRYMDSLEEAARRRGLRERHRARDAQRRRHDDDGLRQGRGRQDAELGPGGGRHRRRRRRRLGRARRTSSASTWAARARTSPSCATASRS